MKKKQQQLQQQPNQKLQMPNMECIQSADYWRKLCPQLTVSNKMSRLPPKYSSYLNSVGGVPQQTSQKSVDSARSNLLNLGYTRYCFSKMTNQRAQNNSSSDNTNNTNNNNNEKSEADGDGEEESLVAMCNNLYSCIKTLMSYGWPPYFVCVYDEIWIISLIIQQSIIAPAFNSTSHSPTATAAPGFKKNDLKFNMDFLAWLVDSKPGNSSGFGPHRDRQPIDLKSSFYEDGIPKYVTCWIPITDASPRNGCLYCIPKSCDVGYAHGDVDGVDPMLRALSSNPNMDNVMSNPFPNGQYSMFSNIRALNVDRGSCLVYSHRLIHWSGRIEEETWAGREDEDPVPERVAMAFAFSDASFQQPYIKSFPSGSILPSVKQRLCLAAGQGIVYNRRLRLDHDLVSYLNQIFCQITDLENFDEYYKVKVRDEFKWFDFKYKNSVSSPASVKQKISPPDLSTASNSLVEETATLTLESVKALAAATPVGAKEKQQHQSSGLGIFKDIFKKSNSGSDKRSLTPSPTSQIIESSPALFKGVAELSLNKPKFASPSGTVKLSNPKMFTVGNAVPPVASLKEKFTIDKAGAEKPKAVPVSQKSKQKMNSPSTVAKSAIESVTNINSYNVGAIGNAEPSKDLYVDKEKLLHAIKQKAQDLGFEIVTSGVLDGKDTFDIPSDDSLDEFLDMQQKSMKAVTVDMTREERAKHMFSVFFNDDGSPKITGSDLRNVVPIVCPDYSSVQRMAQGFFGNAKEFENHGKMFGSIALDLIRNVPLFKRIPDDLPVLYASARRVGLKLSNNHLRSMGQSFNIFLREACYTFLLFFRTIVPTVLSQHGQSKLAGKGLNSTLHSKRIQQDFDTAVAILTSLSELGELYSDPLMDVIDTLMEAARDAASPILLGNACALIAICNASQPKKKQWLEMFEQLLKSETKDEKSDQLDVLLRRCRHCLLFAGKQKGMDWRMSLDAIEQPTARELATVMLRNIKDHTVNYKASVISKLPINDLKSLMDIASIIYTTAIETPGKLEMMADFAVRLSFRLGDFEQDLTKTIMQMLQLRNRSKASKRAMLIRFLLRLCEQRFISRSRSKQKNEVDGEFKMYLLRHKRQKIRNIRFFAHLVRLGMVNHTLVLSSVVPSLLYNNSSNSNSNAQVVIDPLNVECAIHLLTIVGKGLDKGYPLEMDQAMQRLKQLKAQPKMPADVKDLIEYILFKRSSNWIDTWRSSGMGALGGAGGDDSGGDSYCSDG